MRDMSRFCVENFLFLSTEKFFKGIVLCFRKFLVRKNVRDKQAGVMFSVGNFLSHVAEKHRGWTLPCLRKFLVWKKFMDEKGVSRLSVGKVQSQIAAKQRERTIQGFRKFLVSKILCVVGVSRFCRSFLSHSTEKLRRGAPVSQKCSGIE